MRHPLYYVYTWNSESQSFTPQGGVKAGPHRLFGLRKALRKLRTLGYAASRLPRDVRRNNDCGDPSVLVERIDP